MGVDKEEMSSRYTKTFKGHFIKSEVTSLSTFKAELLSHCSSTAVYDIPCSRFEFLLLSNVKTQYPILLQKTESSRLVTETPHGYLTHGYLIPPKLAPLLVRAAFGGRRCRPSSHRRSILHCSICFVLFPAHLVYIP